MAGASVGKFDLNQEYIAFKYPTSFLESPADMIFTIYNAIKILSLQSMSFFLSFFQSSSLFFFFLHLNSLMCLLLFILSFFFLYRLDWQFWQLGKQNEEEKSIDPRLEMASRTQSNLAHSIFHTIINYYKTQ